METICKNEADQVARREQDIAIGSAVMGRQKARIRMDVLREQIDAEDARVDTLRQEFYRLKHQVEEHTAFLKAEGMED